MVDKTLTQVRTDNAAAAPTGVEPIETVQSATSAAFTFAELANFPLQPQTGTTYTLAITDQGKAVTMGNASANTLTIPLNATVAFHIGAILVVRQIGAGATTVAATGGVTVQKTVGTSLTMSEAHEQLTLHKVATDTWHVFADGSAPTVAGPNSCRVVRTTDLAMDGNQTIDWDVTPSYDDDTWYDGGVSTEYFTIPTGVTRVDIMAQFYTNDSTVAANSDLNLIIDHANSSDVSQGFFPMGKHDANGTTPSISGMLMGYPVTPTDRIRLRLVCDDTSYNITQAQATIRDVSP